MENKKENLSGLSGLSAWKISTATLRIRPAVLPALVTPGFFFFWETVPEDPKTLRQCSDFSFASLLFDLSFSLTFSFRSTCSIRTKVISTSAVSVTYCQLEPMGWKHDARVASFVTRQHSAGSLGAAIWKASSSAPATLFKDRPFHLIHFTCKVRV